MGEPPILVVAADDHVFRMLDVTLRLGGFNAVPRRSITEARRLRPGDHRPRAVVVDGGTAPVAAEIRELVAELGVPVVVVLAAAPDADRRRFEAAGARVLVGDYEPDRLHAAVSSGA